jgi:hypothetical protein
MKTKKMSVTFMAVVFTFAAMSPPVFPQGKLSTAIGDVQFQFIGHARIPGPPPTLVQGQIGYLTYINGVSETQSIFDPGPQNEAGCDL